MIARAAAPERTYALVVGIERYAAGAAWDLNGPASDARRMAEWLVQRGVPVSQIRLHLSPDPPGPIAGEPRVLPATREGLRKTLNELHEKRGDLLFIFWGGHGVIGTDGTRRLFYSNATATDKENLDLDDLLRALRTTHFKDFPQQICIVDACANFVEHMRAAKYLPREELFRGNPMSPEPEQFVLLAARAGESAKNLNQECEGLFSKVLLEALSEQQWPLKMRLLSYYIKERFRRLRTRDEANQAPIYWWRKSEEGDLEQEFNDLDLLAASEEMKSRFSRRSRSEVELIAKPLVSETELKKLYRQSAPRNGHFNDQATTMRHVLFELSDLNNQKGGTFPFPLLEFVERLAFHIAEEFPAEASGLRTWVNQAGSQVDVAAQEIQALRDRLRREAGGESEPFHVLVEVIPDQLDPPTKFSLAAFTWSKEKEFEPIDLLPEDSGRLLLQEVESLLVQLVEETLPYLLPDGTTHVVLELFLPRELLCWGVDQLKIRIGTTSTPIGIHHQVIVRWRDRALRQDLYWRRKWRRVKNGASLLPDSIFWIRTPEHYRLNELHAKLISSDDHFCLGLAFSPPEKPETEDLLDTILSFGVPVAFWSRQPLADADNLWQEIERLFRGKRVGDLPEVVRMARLEAHVGEDGMHVGHHFTLLWDDADRRLPGFSQPPFARPRVVEGGERR